MDKKYKRVVPTPDEEKAFNEDFQALAKKHSFQIELIPQFKGNEVTKAYEITCLMLLQKVVEDVEVVVEKAVESPYNEPDKEA